MPLHDQGGRANRRSLPLEAACHNAAGRSPASASPHRTGWPLIILALALVTAVPLAAQTEWMHQRQFRVDYWIKDPAIDEWVQARARWKNHQSILFYVFDRENPEALLKLLDGRRINDHWWADFAVVSDLTTWLRVRNVKTDDAWNVWTGRVKDFYRNAPLRLQERLILCAWPDGAADGVYQCSYGTTVSARDAWDRRGRIPPHHWALKVDPE